MLSLHKQTVVARSDRVLPRPGFDRDPTQLGEFRDAGLTAEPAVAAGFDAAEWHLRFVITVAPLM